MEGCVIKVEDVCYWKPEILHFTACSLKNVSASELLEGGDYV